MKEIAVGKSHVAIIDDDLYEAVSALGPWILRRNRRKTQQAYYAHRHVYRNGKRTTETMHRVIYRLKGIQIPCLIDHKDLNGLNNQWSNLRAATQQQSSRHRRKQVGHSSRFKGVSWRADRNRWVARIYVTRRAITLGHFHTEQEAARAYDEVAQQYCGDWAVLNFPSKS